MFYGRYKLCENTFILLNIIEMCYGKLRMLFIHIIYYEQSKYLYIIFFNECRELFNLMLLHIYKNKKIKLFDEMII